MKTMRRLSALAGLCSISFLGAACGSEPPVRQITLAAEANPPSGETAVVEDTITMHLDTAEPLGNDFRYVVWALVGSDSQPVGVIQTGSELAFLPADAGLTLADVEEVFITEEPPGDDLPTSPSRSVVLRGTIPGPLQFGGTLDAEDFQAVSGHATLSDRTVEVTADLPQLPTGFSYAVWLGHQTASTPDPHVMSPGHDEGTEEPAPTEDMGPMEMMFVGTLDAGALTMTADHSVVTTSMCFISIESDNGSDEVSPSMALSGHVELPESETDGHDHIH